MKLLLDANLSYRLVKKLSPHFDDCIHVSRTGLEQPASDEDIWIWAKRNDYTFVVSNDEDFRGLLNRLDSPPKLILLKVGNLTTEAVKDILLRHLTAIKEVAEDKEVHLLEII